MSTFRAIRTETLTIYGGQVEEVLKQANESFQKQSNGCNCRAASIKAPLTEMGKLQWQMDDSKKLVEAEIERPGAEVD